MKKSLNVASFFSGAGGLDLGFSKEGFNCVFANDHWKPAAATFRKNFPETEFVDGDIQELTEDKIKEILQRKRVSKIDIVIGGPPCQCFTRLNNNNLKKDDDRNQLFREYIRVIKILKPDFVVMENVADLLVRKDTHGNFFKDLIKESFESAGYKVDFKVFETEKYGVPQRRRRVIFLATSKKELDISFPKESGKVATVGEHLQKLSRKKDLPNNEITINEPEVLKRIKHIPQGGYYENLPENLKVKKIRDGKLVTVKRYGSYFRRLASNAPSITVTDNYLIHPEEDRYLTNREVATLHTFPPKFVFCGAKGEVSQQIANAVPPEFAKRIASHLLKQYYKK